MSDHNNKPQEETPEETPEETVEQINHLQCGDGRVPHNGEGYPVGKGRRDDPPKPYLPQNGEGYHPRRRGNNGGRV